MAEPGMEFLYGVMAVVFVCIAIGILIFWLTWRKRHTKETQEVRVIFPDGSVRRTIVTRTDIWPHLGKAADQSETDDDKNRLTENDHVEIIFGESQIVETHRSQRREPVFPLISTHWIGCAYGD